MTTCTHTLGSRTGLVCVREQHADGGHVYHASWSPDLPRDEEVDE